MHLIFSKFRRFIFVAQLKNADTQSVALMVSTDAGRSFKKARIEGERTY